MSLTEHVRSLEQRSRERGTIAFFDLDRTLIDGYSLTALAWQQLFNGEMSLRRFLSLGQMFLRYGLGFITYEQMLQATVDDIVGMSEADLQALGRQAYDARLRRWMYREGAALIDAHKAQGDDVVLVTSATKYQAEPVAEALAIEHLCCTEITIADGRVAGGVSACYGQGKLKAAQRYAQPLAIGLEDTYFYSDSVDDLPLLEAVGYPVVVNGRAKLVKVAKVRGWPTLNFKIKGQEAADV